MTSRCIFSVEMRTCLFGIMLLCYSLLALGDSVSQRPQFHFLPDQHWMNDPIPCQFDGAVHLFFQYNPYGSLWGNMSWGHATSSDLVHWTRRKVALEPGAPWDMLGAFSGSCLSNGPSSNGDGIGGPTAFYTGVSSLPINWALPYHIGAEKQGMARWDAQSETWNRVAGDPFIRGPPESLNVTGFRDPFVYHFIDEAQGIDEWRMLLGSGVSPFINGTREYEGGAVLMYRSATGLTDWQYAGIFTSRPASQTPSLGNNWELPSLFSLSNYSVLTFGAEGNYRWLQTTAGNHTAQWAVGTLNSDGSRFAFNSSGTMDHGLFYAANTMAWQDKRIAWGFISETVTNARLVQRGWANVMSLPRELFIMQYQGNTLVGQRPLSDLTRLRQTALAFHGDADGSPQRWAPSVSQPAVRLPFTGLAYEMRVTIASANRSLVSSVSIAVRSSAADATNPTVTEEVTYVVVDFEADELRVDRGHSSLSTWITETGRDPERAPFSVTADEDVQLTVFVDHSVVEVFANERVVLTTRIYPTSVTAQQVDLVASFAASAPADAALSLLDVAIWPLESIWQEESVPNHHRSLALVIGLVAGAVVLAAIVALLCKRHLSMRKAKQKNAQQQEANATYEKLGI